MEEEMINIKGTDYKINIYHERRRSVRASISRDLINIRIPQHLNRAEQEKHLLKMKSWIIKKISKNPDRFKQIPQKEYNDGDILKVGNEDYILKLNFLSKQSSSAKIVGNILYLSISNLLTKEKQNEHISGLLSRCVAKRRIGELKNKMDFLNKLHFNQKINKIFFKNNSSNWGSCSSLGNINISTKLLFAPEDVLEYVCIHELAHLIERNHSPKFWALVSKSMPDYRNKIDWLKLNGYKCCF